MAGRIREESIAEVREKAPIDEVVSQYVTLKNAGGGSMKGLCPFHDEKTPSFNVQPARGFYHCLAGETRVLTWDGVRPISELAGGTHKILGSRGRLDRGALQVVRRAAPSQGHADAESPDQGAASRPTATDGSFGVGGGAQELQEVLTTSLKRGDRLVSKYPTLADPAGRHRRRSGSRTVSPSEMACEAARAAWLSCARPRTLAMLKWFPNSHTTAKDENLLVHHLPRFFKELPPTSTSRCPYLLRLAGWLLRGRRLRRRGRHGHPQLGRPREPGVRTDCLHSAGHRRRTASPSQTRVGLRRARAFGPLPSAFRQRGPARELLPAGEHRETASSPRRRSTRDGAGSWSPSRATDRVEEVFCAEVEDGTRSRSRTTSSPATASAAAKAATSSPS